MPVFELSPKIFIFKLKNVHVKKKRTNTLELVPESGVFPVTIVTLYKICVPEGAPFDGVEGDFGALGFAPEPLPEGVPGVPGVRFLELPPLAGDCGTFVPEPDSCCCCPPVGV